jgi:hypothetical protein
MFKSILFRIEFFLLRILIKRYSINHLDQWDKWVIETKEMGKVYIFIGQDDPGLGGKWEKLD